MTTYQVLITGANRGLGLEFTKQYAADGWNVVACCRHPQSAMQLQALAQNKPNIKIVSLDMANFAQIDALASQLNDASIDLLINNAGAYHSSSFGYVDYNNWADDFKVNSMAPFKMAEAFVQQISHSQLKKIATITSKMGSIDDNRSGASYSYRSSKCAVNMVMKSLSIDLEPYGISIITLHPGWVRTDMGGPYGLINAQTSVMGMRKQIADLHLGNTGKFVAYDGKTINW